MFYNIFTKENLPQHFYNFPLKLRVVSILIFVGAFDSS